MKHYFCLGFLSLTLLLSVAQGESAPAAGLLPEIVSLCQVLHHPEQYTGQYIEVRGSVYQSAKEFTLRDNDCREAKPVWLEYPDRSSLSASLPIEARRVSLTASRGDLTYFQQALKTRRKSRLDGSECSGHECNLYQVEASLTGYFVAAQSSGPGGRLTGFGKNDCCHALVIRDVFDVSTERTHVPTDGAFRCTQKEWKLSAQDIDQLAGKDCSVTESWGACAAHRYTQIANHWGDEPDVAQGTFTTIGWFSPDLKLSYTFNEKDRSNFFREHEEGSVLTRTSCAPYVEKQRRKKALPNLGKETAPNPELKPRPVKVPKL